MFPHRGGSGQLTGHSDNFSNLTLPPQGGVLFIMTIFFVPETAFIRADVSTIAEVEAEKFQYVEKHSELDPSNSSKVAPHSKLNDGPDEKSMDVMQKEGSDTERASDVGGRKGTFSMLIRSLAPWSGQRYSDESFWKIGARPFTLALSPVVAWGTLVYGTTNVWRELYFNLRSVGSLLILPVSVSKQSLRFLSPSLRYSQHRNTGTIFQRVP